jgi:hypothetical protein
MGGDDIWPPEHGRSGSVEHRRVIDGVALNPWNTTEGPRPLGNLNRAGTSVYRASASHRGATEREKSWSKGNGSIEN